MRRYRKRGECPIQNNQILALMYGRFTSSVRIGIRPTILEVVLSAYSSRYNIFGNWDHLPSAMRIRGQASNLGATSLPDARSDKRMQLCLRFWSRLWSRKSITRNEPQKFPFAEVQRYDFRIGDQHFCTRFGSNTRTNIQNFLGPTSICTGTSLGIRRS